MSSGSLIKYPLSNKVLGFGSRCQGLKKKSNGPWAVMVLES
jgi:hypothetical protein